MKIQCDVCNKDEASVFCVVDETALCNGCDHSVHHANKLATKHHRFSLPKHSPNQFPTCDICQEKRTFLFCQQDRAILCNDCDIPIHRTNEHTKNHNRFLLTGATTLTSTTGEKIGKKSSNGTTISPHMINTGEGCDGTSSISEHLMKNIPGWHVEDLLNSSNSFFKTGENDVLPFWDDDLEGNLNSFSSENVGFWVPEAPIEEELQPSFLYPASNMIFGGQICLQEAKQSGNTTSAKSIRKWRDDGGFAVPEFTPPPSMVFKKSRTLLL